MTSLKTLPIVFGLAAIAVMLALVGCSSRPSAESATNDSTQRFNRVDKNGDGRLTADEIQMSLVEVLFKSRDANKDRLLTQAEWTVAGEEAGAVTFRNHDLNGNGVVTFAEARTAALKDGGMAAEFLKAADKNRDGAIDFREARAYYARAEGPVR